MITILFDFSQFLAKKMAFFLNTNVMINFFQNYALFRVKKRWFFRKTFQRKYLKKHYIGPRWDDCFLSAVFFFENYRSGPILWATFFHSKSYVFILARNGSTILSQTHLVTLILRHSNLFCERPWGQFLNLFSSNTNTKRA
jgi:hypothetical protein